MDIELEKGINDAIEYLKHISADSVVEQLADPIAKMMLVSLMHECQKIRDYVDGLGDKIVEKFCEDFIPRREVEAIPAISIVKAQFKAKKDAETQKIVNNVTFTYKVDSKTSLTYLPLFKNLLVPESDLFLLTRNFLRRGANVYEVALDEDNVLWVGIETNAELESLQGFSFLLKGTGGVIPEQIYVADTSRQLEFVDMSRCEEIEMAEPFDIHQASSRIFSIVENWRDLMLDLEDSALISITSDLTDRDAFKKIKYPRSFQKWLETEKLGVFPDSVLWLKLTFPKGYVVPDDCAIEINAIPVVNVDVNTVTLTQSSPIAKLQQKDDSFFLHVLETSNSAYKQGFNMNEDEIIIRDFDASCYNDGNLYRDVRDRKSVV